MLRVIREPASRLVAGLIVTLLFGMTVRVEAQDPVIPGLEGNNAIWNGSAIAPSTGYIDASPFYNNVSQGNGDICRTVYYILTNSSVSYSTRYPEGAVIDARGILLASGQNSIPCTVDPFTGPNGSSCQGTTLVNLPSTLLLSATPITINCTWILPSNTRIIGEGPGHSNVTAIQIPQNGFTGTSMLQMGPSGGSATGVTIEHLKLEGQPAGTTFTAVDGIDNVSAGDGSYANDVLLADIGETSTSGPINNACSPSVAGAVTGLCISPNATYSGPYTNIDFTAGSNCSGGVCLQTACAKIQAQIRGLHGITCTAKSSTQSPWPAAAIYLDAYNDTINDVHVEGFFDAIVVGDNADSEGGQATSNTIANVTSAFGNGPVQNTVHICNPNFGYGGSNKSACSSSSLPVRNLSLQNLLSNGANGNQFDASTIQDDLTSTTVNYSTYPATFAAIYFVGDSVTGTGGFSRFTTSSGSVVNGTFQGVPTWGFGSTGASGSCTNGAIYTNTSGTSGSSYTIYVCSGGQWQHVK